MNERHWLNISQADYHAMDAISSGALRCFALMGPLEYYARFVGRIVDDEDTDPKRLGRAFHRAMESPDNWRESYVITPATVQDDEFVPAVNATFGAKSKAERLAVGDALNLQVKSHRMYLQCFRDAAIAMNREVLSPSEVDKVHGQVAAVYDNPACMEFVGHKGACNVEVACVSEDADTGLATKALCDLIVGECVVDFKTTRTRNPFDFIRQGEKEGYHYQAAHYLDVTGKEEFRFIAVATEPPYFASVFYVPARVTKRCHDENRAHLKQIRQIHTMAGFNPTVESQGIPLDWMPEGWAGEYPLDMSELLAGGNV